MRGMGFPEFIVVVVIGIIYAIPIVAGIWAIITLNRIRIGQSAIQGRLEAIERAIQSNPSQ
jgi:hypothetical protein